MKTHNLVQGTPEWHRHRAQHDNASDAAAMMCASSYKTRDQLLHERATGITPEVNAATQRLFDSGHRFEALGRPLAEAIIGESLYPVTGAQDEGRMSASFDGLTVQDDVAFEHKRLNSRLRAAFAEIKDAVSTGVLIDGVHKTHCAAQLLPKEYQLQMEQQCAVSGCEKVLFMASEWGENDQLIEEHHCWYTPNLELRAAIVAGWAQFHKDLAAYAPPAPKAAPVVGRAPEHLPALRIEVSGAVTASNLAQFKATALAAIAGVNRTLSTDADFADAEASVKWCSEVESRLAAAKQHALSQTVDIDALFRTMDDIAAEARRVRLELDKLVRQRKEQIRGEMVAGGLVALRRHIYALNESAGQGFVPLVAADFGAAIKGKRSIEGMQSAINDELARAKTEANSVAQRIEDNIAMMRGAEGFRAWLFPDIATIALKARDDFAALVQARIAQQQAVEQQRQEASTQAAAAIAQAAAPAQEQAQVQAEAAPVQVDDDDRINLTAINAYLAPIKLDAAGLSALGFEPVEVVKASKLYRASSLTAIRAALIEHLTHMHEMEAA